MKCPPLMAEEKERLQALSEYGLGSNQPLPSLDAVVFIAARMFDMPVAAVNMVGSDDVFLAASIGIGEVDMRRDVSFCAHAITQDDVMVILDATSDDRFHDNPLVTGSTGLRFYAGVPLRSPQGYALGALCVIDNRPRVSFSDDDRNRLRELADMASDRLELRRIEIAATQARLSTIPSFLSAATAESTSADDDLFRLVNFDMLTGLSNRMRFYRYVEKTLVQPLCAAILIIDLDGFKDINDAFGPSTGDDILKAVALRLTSLIGAGDLVARISGDRFAILLPDKNDTEQIAATAQNIILALGKLITVDEQKIRIGASCGIAVGPEHTQNPLELIGNAELALFRAKANGRGQAVLYTPSLRRDAAARRRHGMELHQAVENGEFILFYQPQVRLADQTLTGAEALIRWRHPTLGLLTPASFLSALETGPLAAIVGAWVLNEACTQAALWHRCGFKSFRVGVNLFEAQFKATDFAESVLETLERHGLPPTALELEITETVALNQDTLILTPLRRLRDRGVGIAFDDFGTGYASLSLLKRYPLTRIKIDKSFVDNMLHSIGDASVVRAVLDMAHAFNLMTIAEGIEQSVQSESLRLLDCEEGQGYLFGKPMPASKFSEVFGIVPKTELAVGT